MLKYIIGVVVFVVVAVGAYYLWQGLGTSIMPPEPPPPPPAAPLPSTYATSTFSITYPSDFTIYEAYAYTAFKGKPISGVKFSVPASLTEGTNLSSDSGVSVEWLPRAQACTGDIYVPANVKAVELTVASTTYSMATSSEAAAGNMYEEQVFALKGSKPCTAVRYFIHSTAIENSPTEDSTEESAVREFDRATIINQFDSIRDALVLTQ